MGRGGRLDAHERRPNLSVHLACEVADPRRDFQARAQDTRGESLALRRVIPSPNKKRRVQARSIKVYVKPSPKERLVLRRTRSECALTVSEMAAPLETSRSCTITIFCQGIALKILLAKRAKIFAPLTTTFR